MELIPFSLESRASLIDAVDSLGALVKVKLLDFRKESEAGFAFSVLDTVVNTGKLMAGSKLGLPKEITGRGTAWLLDVVLHYVTAALRKASPQQLLDSALIMKQLGETLQAVAEREIIIADTILPDLPAAEAEGG